MWRAIIVSTCLVQLTFGADWSYTGDTGPNNWAVNAEACGLKAQSPINIKTESVEYDDNLPIVDRSYFYQLPGGMNVTNNGHTVQVDLTNGYTINDDKLLPFPAKAAQYHFHWGTTADGSYTRGSEHTVNSTRYFGELHVVHYNTKYADLDAAVAQSDGLAVFGWFISVTYPQKNLDIENLLDLAVANAVKKDDQGEISQRFSVETLIPPNLSEYYRYKGSLTTPPCYESVVWTVFKNPIEITQAQAEKLATTFYQNQTDSAIIKDNFRPVQALNGRKVTMPRPLTQSSGSTSTPHLITGLIAMALAVTSLL